jgi:hypothetical protein
MGWLHDRFGDEYAFACALTHDVDRPFKTYQALSRTIVDRDPRQLLDLLPGRNPYWTVDRVLAIERELDVRSSWYFLDEQSLLGDRPLRDWLDPEAWKLYAGRYTLRDPAIRDLVTALDRGGWEVGLHGSYESYRDVSMLAAEKARLEAILGHEVAGGRQHYMNVERPDTWQRQRAVGLGYDASPGSSDAYGFEFGYEPFRPFDDGFLVFPTAVMDAALPHPGRDWAAARDAVDGVLCEARENDAVLTVLWHPRYFSADYPGYGRLYRWLIERALEMEAWVGPLGDLYAAATRRCGRTKAAIAEE